MTIELRDAEVPFPGSVTRFFDVTGVECTNYTDDQALAFFLQGNGVANRGCTLKGGKGYTDATVLEITTACEAV